MKTYRIACIPGDGIGKEVIPAGQRVLEMLARGQDRFGFAFTSFGWGGDWYRAHGRMMPDDGLDALRGMDAILFGSAGDPQIPDHVTLWGLRLKICQGFDQYANVRPTRILPGIDSPLKRCGPRDLDWVIVRENSEGEYAGVGGRAHQGHPIEVATDVSILTRAGVEILREGQRLGRIRADVEPELILGQFFAIVRGWFSERPVLQQIGVISQDDRTSDEAYLRSVLKVFVDGLRPRA